MGKFGNILFTDIQAVKMFICYMDVEDHTVSMSI